MTEADPDKVTVPKAETEFDAVIVLVSKDDWLGVNVE